MLSHGNTTKKKKSVLRFFHENREILGNQIFANTFNQYFSTIGSKLAMQFQQTEHYKICVKDANPNSFFMTPVTEYELEKEINKLVKNKAPGIDDIPSR
jgi:hypothetical protein